MVWECSLHASLCGILASEERRFPWVAQVDPSTGRHRALVTALHCFGRDGARIPLHQCDVVRESLLTCNKSPPFSLPRVACHLLQDGQLDTCCELGSLQSVCA
jgi:hypothetical protein